MKRVSLVQRLNQALRRPGLWLVLLVIVLISIPYYNDLIEHPSFINTIISSLNLERHAFERILYLAPILLAGILFGWTGAFITSFFVLACMLPRVIIISTQKADALFETGAVFIVGNVLALTFASLRREREYRRRLEVTQQQLIQASKLAALGQLSASVAHEINNPLAGVLVYTRLLKENLNQGSLDKDKALSNLSKVESAIDYCSIITRGLLDFARQSPPQLRPVTVSRVIEKAMSLVGQQAKMKKIEIKIETAGPLPLVEADFNQLTQVFVNLIVNAVQAMNEGGKLVISSFTDGGQVKIGFQDNGCGISPENMSKLFTPFFSTKVEVKGVGLGLAVSYGIAGRHGGTIEATSQEGKGSTFTVCLPSYIPGSTTDYGKAR
jgi:signal transduction histidine kinase